MNSELRRARKVYFQHLLLKESRTPQTFWKNVKMLMPSKCHAPPSSLQFSGHHCSDPVTLANVFNDYRRSEIFAVKNFHQLLRRRKLNAQKIKYTYTHYTVEPLGGEIFLMQKFKTRIIFTAKISRSKVFCEHRTNAQ